MQVRLIVLVVLSLVLFTANIGGLSIFILDEAKNSTAAREMLDRGNLIVPTFNAELRTDKPPLHYYFMMVAYKIFGVNEFAARFFSAFFGILTVLSTYLFTRRFIHEDAAFWTALVILTSLQFVTQFHLAVPDPYLIFFFSSAMFLGYYFYAEKKTYGLFLAYACIGLAILTKGPVALILSGAVFVLFLLSQKNFNLKTIQAFRPLTGIALMLLICIPWYIAVHILTDGAWTTGFFLKHNVGRFTNAMEGHGGNFLLIPLFIITGLFPFSIFIWPAIRSYFQNRMNPFLSFAAVVVVVVTVFFSFSGTKLPSYPAPAFPFAAILIGFYLSQSASGGLVNLKWKIIYGIYILISIAIPIALYLVIEDTMFLPELKNLAFWFLLIPLGAIVGLVLYLRKLPKHSLISIAGSWIATIIIFYYVVFPEIDSKNTTVQAMKVIDPKASVFYYKKYNPSFSFYIHKPILPISDSILNHKGSEKIFLITMKKHMPELHFTEPRFQVVYQNKEFFESYHTVILYADPQVLSYK